MTNPCDPESQAKSGKIASFQPTTYAYSLGPLLLDTHGFTLEALHQSRPALLKERGVYAHSPSDCVCAEKESRGQCQWQWGEKGLGWDRGRSQEGFPEEVTFQHEGLSNRRNELILQHGFWSLVYLHYSFHQWLFPVTLSRRAPQILSDSLCLTILTKPPAKTPQGNSATQRKVS